MGHRPRRLAALVVLPVLVVLLGLPHAALAGAPAAVRLIVRTQDPARAAAFVGGAARPLFPVRRVPSPVAFPRQQWHLLTLPDGADAVRAAKVLVAHGLALSAEVDGRTATTAAPDDPLFGTRGSWGQLYDDQWGIKALGIEAAWSVVKGSPSVTVAVIDTGVDLLQPDMAQSLWRNPGETAGNGIDDDGNGYVDDVVGYDFASGAGGRDADPTDGFGHGTLVGGIIAADTDNGVGVAGVTWGCRIMALRALDDTGSGYVSDAGQALLYAIDEGAKVVNMSLAAGGRSSYLESLVASARAAGVVCVASAGNLGIDVESFTPANIDDCVTVAATGLDGKPPSWSDFGDTIDVAAPGVDILGPRALATDFQQTGAAVVASDYYRASGTSFAAAEVSGVLALLRCRYPGLSSDTLVNVLRASATDVAPGGVDAATGWGTCNAAAALQLVRGLTARIDGPAHRQLLSFGAPLSVTGTAAGSSFASWQLFIGSGLFPASLSPLTGVRTNPVSAGTLFSGPSTGYARGLYTLVLRATATDGTRYEDRRVIEIDHTRGIIQGTASWQVGGTPATSVTVWVMDAVTQDFLYTAAVDGSGAFRFDEGVPAGTYVLFADASYSEFDSEYWQDTLIFANATRVTVTPMGTTGGIDFRLAREPRVAGIVRDEGGNALSGRLVELLYKGTQTVAATAVSAADGSYLLWRLPVGDFYVRARAFDAADRVEWWQESPDVGSATSITLAVDQTISSIDFTLKRETGVIQGTVRDTFGAPLASFPVELLATAGGLQRSAVTDATGAWAVTSLPPGSYRVRTGADYERELQYYDGSPGWQGAKILHLFEGGTIGGIDFRLRTTWFRDVTAQSGVLQDPESNGTIGIVAARLDCDGRPDLYLVNEVGPNGWLLQDGAGQFHDEAVARGAGAADLKAQAVAFDLDNDGDEDLYVAKYGRFGAGSLNVLLENDGSRYRDTTFPAGVVDARIGTDAAVGDYDGDGFLDLYLVNNFEENVLYRNAGDGTFQDVTAPSGAGGTAANNTQNATFADVDGDGDPDLFVTCSEFPTSNAGNLLFINQGNGTFAEEGTARGVRLPSQAFASTFGDVDADGNLDLFVGSPYGGVLYENDGTGRFIDRTAAFGLSNVQQTSGCSFGDVDDDGNLDLAIADYQGGAALYMGTGSGFADRSSLTGFVRYGQSRNLVLVDLDLDGRLDVVLSHDSTANRIYRNRRPVKRWLEVKLHGSRSNRDGIGAIVRATSGGRTQTRVCGTGDAGNKVYPVVHFGLGSAPAADLQVLWPSGVVQQVAAVAADRLVDLYEPVGRAIVAAPGPGPSNPPQVRLFASDGSPLALPVWNAYGSGYGARVAAGLLLPGPPHQGIVTMPGDGPSLGPHVRGWEEDGTPIPGVSFFAYGTLKYGGNPALAGGLDPLTDVILTGPGAGAVFGPQIRGFASSGAALPGLSFNAYTGVYYGARPGSSDLDGDGRGEVLSAPGPGPGYAANVRSFRYTGNAVQTLAGGSFFAFPGPTAGAHVAGGEGFIVASPGPSQAQLTSVRGFAYQGGAYVPLPGYDAIVFPGHVFGAIPALEDLDGAGFDEAVVAPGPEPSYRAHVRGVRYDGSAVVLMGKPNFFAFDPSIGYGASAAAAPLSY